MNKRYDIVFTNKFKKNYIKMKQQTNFKNEEFEKVIEILSSNELLPSKYNNIDNVYQMWYNSYII